MSADPIEEAARWDARLRADGVTEQDFADFQAWRRANPDGAEAGRRTTANGIDVNRDHLLLQTPEAQAQAILMRNFVPIVAVDAHEYTVVGRFLEKFGAVQR